MLTIDLLSKMVVTSSLVEGRLYALVPGWGVRLVSNRRASLSVVQAAAILVVILTVVVASEPGALTAVGLGMAIGGAAGNLLDRIRRGAVVDFVAAGRWPVFNLADAGMTIGLVVAAVSVL
jgi:signal peptidase II